MKSSLRVLRIPSFRYLFLGQSASSVGDQAVIVALALYVTRRTGSPTDLGLVLAAESLTLITFVLFGGVIADRLPRQPIMIASDCARALLHAVVAALILTGGASILELIVIEALFGAARAFFQPAYSGLLPQTIDGSLVQEAQALSATTANLAILVGPALGTALVLSAGAGTAFALDAATFALSALLLTRVRVGATQTRVCAGGDGVGAGPRDGAGAGHGEPSLLGELREGWHEVIARPWVAVTIAAFTIAMFSGYAAWYALAPTIAHRLYGAASVFGVLESVAGGGALLGALIGLRWRPRRPLVVALWLTVPWTLQSVAFALHAPLALVLVLAFAAGAGFALFSIFWDTALAVHVPAVALSRVNSYDWMGSLALLPLGFAVAGPLAAAFGARGVLIAGSAIAGTCLLGALVPRSTRALTGAPGECTGGGPAGARTAPGTESPPLPTRPL